MAPQHPMARRPGRCRRCDARRPGHGDRRKERLLKHEVRMKLDWRNVIVGGMMGVVVVASGCASQTASESTEARIEANDPNARAFHGTIVSLRPMKSTMLVSKDDQVGNTRF